MWDQLLVGAAPGDAITNNMLLLHGRLARLGPSNIYSEHLEGGLAATVRPLSDLPIRPNRDRPLIFHASMGSWPVYEALRAEPRLILIYHNFSPPDPFVAFAPAVAGDLVRGRWELEQLRDRVELAIADSEYNAQELRDLGYRDVVVVPPTPDIGRLDRVTPDPAMLARADTWGPGPLVLCVAQQLPHKRIDRVLAAMAVLQQEHLPEARLAYVGVDRFHQHSVGLRTIARTFGLREPQMLGRVTDAELSALYLRARAFLTLSEHEGFCVPVVEAMALGVPVVASNRAAIPSTVDDAGIIIDDPDDPVTVAAYLNEVLVNDQLRWILIGRGVSRARQLAAPSSLPRLVQAVVGTEPAIADVVRDRILAAVAPPGRTDGPTDAGCPPGGAR